MKVSACIVTFNEEKMIEDCLKSLSWVDEIIILDGYSTDGTVEIARKYTDKVELITNQYNPEINKNICIKRAVNDWVFVIDADERVSNNLKDEIMSLGSLEEGIVGFEIPMKNFWRNTWLQYGGFYPKSHIRLFNKRYVRYKAETVHNGLIIDGNIGKLNHHMLHYAFQDVFECIEKMNKYSEVESDNMLKNNVNGYYRKMFFVPLKYFIKTFIVKKGYKDGFAGFAVSILSVITYFMFYLKYIDKLKSQTKA
jgi:glycosyltransferase involved in cell wall biosynthesis